jgi:DNA-binding transcriptional ArsR family regulator
MELMSYGQNPRAARCDVRRLGRSTRRAILARLIDGEASVTELAKPFADEPAGHLKHLKVLERAGLVSRGRDAARPARPVEIEPLKAATGWLEEYRPRLGGQLRPPRRASRGAQGAAKPQD